MVQLVEFRAEKNALSGTVPREWPFPIEVLELSTNRLQGQFHLNGETIRLTKLGLQENELTGTFPNEIVNMVDLKSLKLSENHLNGTLPSGLGNLKSLEVSFLLFGTLCRIQLYIYTCLHSRQPLRFALKSFPGVLVRRQQLFWYNSNRIRQLGPAFTVRSA